MRRNKPSLLVLFLGVIVFLMCSGCSGPGNLSQDNSPSRPEGKPNIIFIMTDDQSVGTMEYMPILNRELVDKGINFTNGYVTTPLCCPSRASVLSGQYAYHHGVLDNRLPIGGALLFDDVSTVGVWMKNAGYRTAYLGKYLNDYVGIDPLGYVPPGWDEWQAFLSGTRKHRYYLNYSLSENGNAVKHGTDETDYSTDLLAKRAVEFIRDSKDQPFLLVFSPYAPHQPHIAAKRHDNLYRKDEDFVYIFNKPSFNEADTSDKPEWLRGLELADAEQAISVYQRSIRSLLSVDEAIGQFLEALDAIDQRDNTVIIFFSDNGYSIGEHRLLSQKNCGYDECIKVPFVIYYPKLVPSARQEDRFVLNIDIAPTIADLAGIEIPDTVDGKSLVPLMKNSVLEWRDAVFFEHWRLAEGFGGSIPDFVGIRTTQWKYIEYDTGEKELYDMENDPFEIENLAQMEQYQSLMADFADRLVGFRGEMLFTKDYRGILRHPARQGWDTTDTTLPEE